jgi:hypothetical protein
MDMATEMPMNGTTEIWKIVNLTMDAHPMHSHLVQFQLVSRQKFNMKKYMQDYMMMNPVIPVPMEDTACNPPVEPYLIGKPMPPDPNEMGWKDTYRAYPDEITTFIIRYTPQGTPNGTPFAFDPTAEPGYVWHCHILEHEENQMMRPLMIMGGPMNPKVSSNNLNYLLKQNYPNPFNPSTTISYVIPEKQFVTLKVYDFLGREVSVLENKVLEPGEYSLNFNGKNLSTGVYFCKLQAGNFTQTMRMMLIK